MSDWKKRGKKQGSVVYFPYVSEQTAQKAEIVYLWDVDKTYLDTKFESLRGLWRTATEKAQSKKNVPGAAELVRCIRDAHADFPLFFITASPPQMEDKIHEKLKIDGVDPYGIFFKDNLENLRPKKLWQITKHVGYKLQALLQLRMFLADNVRMVMFGDDGESDAVIYSLFSDICARRLDSGHIRKILNHHSVLDFQVNLILQLQDACPPSDPVEKIYINLAEDTDSDYYLKFGRRTVPTYNAFQAALDLFQDGRLEENHVVRVADRLVQEYDYTREELERGFDDMIRRERLGAETVAHLTPLLQKSGTLPKDYSPSIPARAIEERAGKMVVKFEGSFDPWVPDRVDYLSDYR